MNKLIVSLCLSTAMVTTSASSQPSPSRPDQYVSSAEQHCRGSGWEGYYPCISTTTGAYLIIDVYFMTVGRNMNVQERRMARDHPNRFAWDLASIMLSDTSSALKQEAAVAVSGALIRSGLNENSYVFD